VERWIIEADIYRLHKELREGPAPEVRPKLLGLLRKKEALLQGANWP
jgi:hypothetical protein